MRFASRFGKYRHGARAARNQFLGHSPSGGTLTTVAVPELAAKFIDAKLILTEPEIQAAMRSLPHRGLPIDQETNEHATARPRISGFDSYAAQAENGWTDEEREIVEQALLASPHLGTDHILLEAVKAQKPWPTYDEDSPEQVVSIARAIGLVDEAITYERENAARVEVLVELAAGEPVEAPVFVDAS